MEADLAPDGLLAWARLGFGLAVFLLPGLAAADRIFRSKLYLLTAPVFSFSLLPLVAIALDFGLGVPIHVVTTHAIALAVAGWLGWPRAVQAWGWMAGAKRPLGRRSPGDAGAAGARPTAWQRVRRVRPAWALLVLIPMLMLVHGLQHVPGDSPVDEPSSAWDAYPSLGRHLIDALQGDDYPYPIHVDEHIHMAFMAQIDRQHTADIVDPYTKLPGQKDLFSVQGMRSERGFDVAIVQFHHLTGLAFAAIARWLPAIWAGSLGGMVYLALRPAPGAVAAVALVAVLPTDVRFLGVGYLIPSPFGLAWLLLTLIVAQRVSGAGRFFGLLLLVTAAHFIHLVIGILAILAAIAGTLTRDDARGRRAGMLVAALLPLLWVLPTTLHDAQDALTRQHTLPFNVEFLAIPGAALYVLAALGTALAWMWPRPTNQAHRAMSLMAIPMAISLLLSIRYAHHNEGTYARQVFALMLMLVGLASYGLADGVRRLVGVVPAVVTAARARGMRGEDAPPVGEGPADAAPRVRPPARAWGMLRWAAAVSSRKPRPPARAWGMPLAALRHMAVAVVVIVMLAAPLTQHMLYEPYRVHGPDSWDAARTLAASGVGPGDVFLSHPWEAPVYNSITGAVPYTVLRPGSPPERGSEWDHYVRSDGADEKWLDDRGITVVVSSVPPQAPHRVLGENVFRLT